MADALYNAILGNEAPIANTPTQKTSSNVSSGNGFTDQEIDNLIKTESSKNPYAINKDTKAMGVGQFTPETLAMLHKQGIKFDPFDPDQSRSAIKTYLETLRQQTGSKEKALASYGGFKTKDPSAYVGKILQTNQKSPQSSSNDPLYNAILNGETTEAPQQKQQTQQQKPMSYMDKFAQRFNQAKQSNEPLAGIGEAVASNVINPLVSTAGAIKGIVQSIPEAIRTGQAPAPIGEQIGGKFIAEHQFEPKTETGKAINEFISSIPEKLTGSSMGVGLLPEVLPFAGAHEGVGTQVKGSKAKLGAQLEKAFPKFEQAEVATQEPTLAGVGAAKVEPNPYSKLTGEETARGEYPVVKLSKTPTDVGKAEQKTRSQIAQEIMPNEGVREGVITGNENTLRNEHTLAKSSNVTPEGEVLKRQIANEQNALSDYALKRIENTGADQLLQNDYERGQRISDAFSGSEGATEFFKKAKKALYEDARAKVGDNPIPSNHVGALFENPQFKAGAGLRGNEGVLKSAESLIKLARETGFEDEFGNKFAPNSVGAWDAVKKALNQDWTHDNAQMIGKINRAIDKDIASAGGGDLLKKADALHQAEKEIFGSKGIKSIFGEVDSNGVQTGTPFEKIPSQLNSLPVDQWRHVYDTADKLSRESIEVKGHVLNIPPELREAAQAAKNEIAGSIAREIHQAGAAKVGVWNQNSVNKVLNARSEKIKHAFPLSEQQAFHTLNLGGHIMPGVHSYEGAGLHNQRVGLISSRLPAAGELTGAFLGGAPGAWTGKKIGEFGEKITGNIKAGNRAKNLEKSLKENAKLGNKISDIGKQ